MTLICPLGVVIVGDRSTWGHVRQTVPLQGRLLVTRVKFEPESSLSHDPTFTFFRFSYIFFAVFLSSIVILAFIMCQLLFQALIRTRYFLVNARSLFIAN